MKGRLLAIGIAIASVISLMFVGSLIEVVDASEVVRIQGLSGSVTWYTTPGPKPQMLGKVTRFARRGTIQFHPAEDGDHRLPIKFNDNGAAMLKGQVNYTIPTDEKSLEDLYANFPGEDAIQQRLVRPSLTKSILVTGNLMNSFESYKEKRSMLAQFIEDQMENGTYQTRSVEREVDEETLNSAGEPITVKKRITEIQIVTNPQGQQVRAEAGQLAHYGVAVDGFAIEEIDYSDTVDKQIEGQQAISMGIQTSIAEAKQAIQRAVTSEAQGRANVAQARAQQEIAKTVAVVEAEKLRDVSKLNAEQARFYKDEQILRAEADAGYKRAIMNSDGALAQKLATYEKVQGFWAEAFSKYGGNITPSVVTGGGTGASNTNAMENFMSMLGAKAALDLGLQLGVSHRTPQ